LIGILTEKPSAKRNFAAALGGEQGTYNNENYVIVSARGHLYEFVNPDEMCGNNEDIITRFKKWNPENLPWDETLLEWTYKPKKDTENERRTIYDVLSDCDEIVIATDVDPTGEGELLAWEILSELKLSPREWSRMYFTDEAPKSIQDAFVNRKPISSMMADMDYVKALYRSQWDFLSMQWTRIATSFGDGVSVLRQGRLKSAMVLMVGNQLKAVAEYKKVPYYSSRFKDENGNVYTNPDEPVYKTKDEVPSGYTSSAVVIDKTEHKTMAPKPLIDLSTLSAMLSSKGIKAKTVLDTYQKMYEAQIVSYPRTEDKQITPEQFNELLPFVDKIANVVGVNTSVLTHRTPRKTHVKTGGAHGANRPGVKVPASLADLSKFGSCAQDIYVILAKSYLAMLCEDYEYDTEYGHIEKYPDFKGSVNIPTAGKAGWKTVFDDSDDSDADDNAKHLGKNASPFIHEGFPPKPANPTMKWLMKQLGKADIGTGATRVSTYADVTSEKSKYPLMKETKGKLTLADCGEKSYKLLPGTVIGSLDITKEVMSDMKDISEKKKTPADCLRKIRDYIKQDIVVMRENGKSIEKIKNLGTDVPRYKGVFNGKDVTFKKVYSGYEFTDDECAKLCAGETLLIDKFVSAKTGKTFSAYGNLQQQEYNGHTYFGFKITEFPKRGIPDVFQGHKFTDDEKSALLSGQTLKFNDLVSAKTGKNYTAELTYDNKDDKINMTFPKRGIPDKFQGHVFTDAEKTALEAGKTLTVSDLVSAKTGKIYSANLAYDSANDKLNMSFDDSGKMKKHKK